MMDDIDTGGEMVKRIEGKIDDVEMNGNDDDKEEPEIYSESNEERTAEVRSLLGGVICGQKISMVKHELIDLNRLERMGA
ncbi:hypothetical protein PPACK8108_LOCUS24609 [Phakopsora pachyrhizi]|uniref:Uncharacterized protein n=1 Tax=Phakopsora pachyrhizi TaxID=170000 RepID=A0AAV0BRY5_PHAPC|nr:hypothetical protein PPACK8108_LOCUS24609 [Phakopsora pachyrhizi]